jgi:HK97 family phage prohead protease
VDSDGDELVRGAFKKSLQENGPGSSRPRIMHLLQHSSWQPLFRFTEEGTLKEDDKGLFFRSTISKTTYGRDTLMLYDDGVLNEHSIGFQTIKEQQTDQEHNQILEVKLWEGSTVTWGANMDTPVTGMKSLTPKEQAEKFNEKIEILSKSLRNGNYTDETFILLDIQLKQIQAHYQSLIDAQPDKPLEDDEPTQKVSLSNIFDNIKL